MFYELKFISASVIVLICLFVSNAQLSAQKIGTVAKPRPKSSTSQQLPTLLNKGIANGYPGIAFLNEDLSGRTSLAAVGFSDIEHCKKLLVRDRFNIASITKTFTAAAILHLVDQKKLSLNDTLGNLLGDAVSRIPYADQITVAQLLDHSSGIYATNNDTSYVNSLIGPNAEPRRVWSPTELLALANEDRQKPLGLPGSGHHYSDTNYVLLGMIVEKTSGRLLKEFITKTFFEPLGMRSTYFYSDHLSGKISPSIKPVQGYLLATPEIRSIVEINPMFRVVPGMQKKGGDLVNTTLAAERIDAAGGVVSTLSDLARFASALFRGKLLKSDSQKFLMSASDGMNSQPIGTARIRTLQSIRKPYGTIVYKEGDGPGGVNTLMAYLPSQDRIFVGFTNSFGYFNEIDFMMNEVIAPLAASN